MKTASELDIPARPWVPDLLAIATVFIIMLPIAMLNGTYTGSMVEVQIPWECIPKILLLVIMLLRLVWLYLIPLFPRY